MWKYIKRWYGLIRFGKLTEVVRDTIANVPCEISYLDKNGIEQGFWAYGSFHPAYPYRGQDM